MRELKYQLMEWTEAILGNALSELTKINEFVEHKHMFFDAIRSTLKDFEVVYDITKDFEVAEAYVRDRMKIIIKRAHEGIYGNRNEQRNLEVSARPVASTGDDNVCKQKQDEPTL